MMRLWYNVRMNRRSFLLGAMPALAAAKPILTQTDLWSAREGDYHSYRIPALLPAGKGALLAFCEGRRNSSSDTGDIDMLLKRSADAGKTWTDTHLIADHGADTIGNPCPVVDRKTGIVWMLLTGNPGKADQKQMRAGEGPATRTVWVASSPDGGVTWSAPKEITSAVKRPDWTWYATGPGVGIQLKSGRLLIPCDHNRKDSGARHSHVIYSDDHGETWKIGGVLGENTNECQVVELPDGDVLINMRSYHGKNRRAIARSKDGGLSWSAIALDQSLIEPVCQASLIRYGKNLLFANPADLKRIRMTIRLSRDGGATWPQAKLLHEGPSGYSSLAVLRDGLAGCLYERGEKSYAEKITFARFNPDWLRPRP